MYGLPLRLLDVVQRELGAEDVRYELGGRDPDDPSIVWHRLDNGWRLVVVFGSAVTERPGVEEKLKQLVSSFAGLIQGAAQNQEEREPRTHRLDDELEALAVRAGAVGAVVIDDKSPVLWGTSEPRRDGSDVDGALRIAGWIAEAQSYGLDLLDLLELEDELLQNRIETLEVPAEQRANLVSHLARMRSRGPRSAAAWRRQLLIARAIERVRQAHDIGASGLRIFVQEDDLGVLARSFANIYRVVLAFGGAFSELQAEGALIHALPLVEKLVLALPPVDPEPGARVLRLPRNR